MAIVGISHGPEISVGVRSGMVGSEGDKGKKGKILPGLEGPPIDGMGRGSLSAEGTAQLRWVALSQPWDPVGED